MDRKLAVSLGIALCLVGCDSSAKGEAVPLLTGVNACYAGGETGMKGRLLVDPDHGTRFNDMPIMWPVGFTARRAGDGVEVLDEEGNVIATTGRDYYMSHAPVFGEKAELLEEIGGFAVAANCGYPWDFIDCSGLGGAMASECKSSARPRPATLGA